MITWPWVWKRRALRAEAAVAAYAVKTDQLWEALRVSSLENRGLQEKIAALNATILEMSKR